MLVSKGKQVASVILFQAIAFGITFVCNILVIRKLPINEYAIFTICIQTLTIVTSLSDSGITPTFRRLAGKYWESRRMFSQIVKSLLQLRNQLLLGIVPLSACIGAYLFYRQGISALNIAEFLVLLCILVYLEVQKGMYLEILRSQLQVKTVQLVENLLNLARLVLVLMAFFILNIHLMLVIYIIASIITLWYAKSKGQLYYNVDEPAKPSYKKIMRAKYIELLPNSVYFIIQSQITLFLLSYFHSSVGVAGYGAIGRITVVYNMLNAVVLNIFTIKFSRIQDIKKLRVKFLQSLIGFFVIGVALFGLIYLFQHQVVSILGDKYKGTEKLLIMLTLNSTVNFILGSINMMNNAKAWVFYNARFSILVSIASLILGVYILDFSKIENVILFPLLPILFTGLLKIADSLRGLKLAF